MKNVLSLMNADLVAGTVHIVIHGVETMARMQAQAENMVLDCRKYACRKQYAYTCRFVLLELEACAFAAGRHRAGITTLTNAIARILHASRDRLT
jgi:hypothetical protein